MILGMVKNEVFYGRDWRDWTLDDFMYFIDRYLHWFRNERIKAKRDYRSQMSIELNLV